MFYKLCIAGLVHLSIESYFGKCQFEMIKKATCILRFSFSKKLWQKRLILPFLFSNLYPSPFINLFHTV